MAQNQNPLQPVYQAPPTWLNPSYATGAQSAYNTNLPPGAINALSPTATLQQIMAGYAPEAASATNNLNNELAASGIQGGPAVTQQTELQSSLLGSVAPTIANAIQTAQGNVLGAQEFQSGQGLQQALANANLGEQTSLNNAGIGNQVGEYNVSNANNANQFNATEGTNAGMTLAEMLNSNWGQELGQFGNIQDIGEEGMNELGYGASQDFPVAGGEDWASLGEGLGGASQQQPGESPYQVYDQFYGGEGYEPIF